MTTQDGFRGAIFDVDGVLVDSPHERAWRDTLQELMETRWSDIRSSSEYAADRFTPRVYQDVVSGKPRLSGARAVLDHFDVPDAATRAAVYAELKQERVVELIQAGEWADAVFLRKAGDPSAQPIQTLALTFIIVFGVLSDRLGHHRVMLFGPAFGAVAVVLTVAHAPLFAVTTRPDTPPPDSPRQPRAPPLG